MWACSHLALDQKLRKAAERCLMNPKACQSRSLWRRKGRRGGSLAQWGSDAPNTLQHPNSHIHLTTKATQHLPPEPHPPRPACSAHVISTRRARPRRPHRPGPSVTVIPLPAHAHPISVPQTEAIQVSACRPGPSTFLTGGHFGHDSSLGDSDFSQKGP